MKRFLITAAVAALLLEPAAQAQARSIRAQAKAQPSAAIKARQTAMDDFSARMGRLDRLMGVPSVTAVRSRSAEAGR